MKEYPHQPLSFVDYDPAWPILYREEEERIREGFGTHLVRIEHIGSTAIPGLPGKSIVDILVVIDSDNNAESCKKILDGLDYQYVDRPDQYYFRRSTGETTGFHLHMTTPDNKFWKERVAFRDYLLAHPGDKENYIQLKKDLIKEFGNDKRVYREGKNDFMADITNKAMKEFGDL